MILPDLVNSMLFLWIPPVLLAELCSCCGQADDTWRGRHSSDSVSEIFESLVICACDTGTAASSAAAGAELSGQFRKASAAMTGNRYLSSVFIYQANLRFAA